MTNCDIEHNFNLCMNWIKANAFSIGNNPLYIGWGDNEYNHPWNVKEFANREYSLQINGLFTPICIQAYGCGIVHIYGYTRNEVEEWNKISSLSFRHTLDDLPIAVKEKFLCEWKQIKRKIIYRIDAVNELGEFEV